MTPDEPTRTVRKLAAIVVSDVVGYSRQMAADEVGTLARLRALRAQILDPLMHDHGGRIVKLMGDGILAEFASAVSATDWAVAVQHAICERNELMAEPDRMKLRIGVNIGDVILENDDIFGDGVNVAARLEPLAPIGGVCISGAVHEQVRGKIAAEFVAGGERSLKNIARPVAVWSWSPSGEDMPAAPPSVRDQGRKPTLAVRPFETAAGGSAEAASLTAGVYEATVLALSNLSGITLLPDASRPDFVASGSIHVVGQRYRATMRLVDNRSGQQFWSDRFDGDLAEFFDAQDDLALRISTAIRYSIYDHEVAETERIPASERTGEMLFARIGQTLAGANREDWAGIGPALDAMLASDPSNSGAHAFKATWHLYEVFHGWRELSSEDRDAAIRSARESVRCNERSDFAHLTMAFTHLYAERDTKRALAESDRALVLSPYYALARYSRGLSLAFDGDASGGQSECLAAARASSRTVVHHRMLQGAALAAFLAGRSDEALDLARRADLALRDVAPTLLILAAAAAAAGSDADAQRATSQILRQFPDFQVSRMRHWPFVREDDRSRFEDALRSSGLPD